ncbi:hypothetical protein IMG5_086910, partial [Ichthyophthirius multifiliis]
TLYIRLLFFFKKKQNLKNNKFLIQSCQKSLLIIFYKNIARNFIKTAFLIFLKDMKKRTTLFYLNIFFQLKKTNLCKHENNQILLLSANNKNYNDQKPNLNNTMHYQHERSYN